MTKKTRGMPPPVGKQQPTSPATRRALLATASLVAIIAVAVIVVIATKSTSTPPTAPPATPSASDRNAPAGLIRAANAVDFHPTYEPGVGVIESQPASAGHPPENPNLLPVGTRAPGFTLKTPQGEKVSLAQYRGKTVLLEFFATWCPHCNAEAPHLRKLNASLPKSTYAIISVNADGETAPSVFAFHRYYGLQYPALVDPSSQPGSFSTQGAAGAVTNAYRVAAYPTFYIIDPQGKIAWSNDGEQPDALLRQELAKAAQR